MDAQESRNMIRLLLDKTISRMDDVAANIQDLEKEIIEKRSLVKEDILARITSMKEDIVEKLQKLHLDVEHLRTTGTTADEDLSGLRDDVDSARKDMDRKVRGVRADTDTKIGDLRTDLCTKVDAIEKVLKKNTDTLITHDKDFSVFKTKIAVVSSVAASVAGVIVSLLVKYGPLLF